MILPIIINLTDFKNVKVPEAVKKIDCHFARMLCFLAGLLYLSFDGNLGIIQFYCLLAFPLVLFYNGKPGTRKLKYLFYIFYPAHLVVIEGLAIILQQISN